MHSTGEETSSTTTPPSLLSSREGFQAQAVHYEVLCITKGDAAQAALGPEFTDAHRHTAHSGTRLVSGYLGLETSSDDAAAITSHGRVVGVIAHLETEPGLRIERNGATEWPKSGFAVMGSRFGDLDSGPDGSVTVTGDQLMIYLVHGPAGDKVDERIEDLIARATVFGHPLPLERA